MIGPRLSRSFAGDTSNSYGSESKADSNSKAVPHPPQYSTDEDGLVPRCLAAAFEGIGARAPGVEFKVTTSCIELYNEVVTDLLGPDRAKQCQVSVRVCVCV